MIHGDDENLLLDHEYAARIKSDARERQSRQLSHFCGCKCRRLRVSPHELIDFACFFS